MKAGAKGVLPLPRSPAKPMTSPGRARAARRPARPAVAASSGRSKAKAVAALTAHFYALRVPRRNRRTRLNRFHFAAGGRAEHRFERGNSVDHVLLRHRVGRATFRRIGERLEIGTDGRGRRGFSAPPPAPAPRLWEKPAAPPVPLPLVAAPHPPP